MPVTKYFPRIHSSPKQKEQIFFRVDPTTQRPLRICFHKSSSIPTSLILYGGTITDEYQALYVGGNIGTSTTTTLYGGTIIPSV